MHLNITRVWLFMILICSTDLLVYDSFSSLQYEECIECPSYLQTADNAPYCIRGHFRSIYGFVKTLQNTAEDFLMSRQIFIFHRKSAACTVEYCGRRSPQLIYFSAEHCGNICRASCLVMGHLLVKFQLLKFNSMVDFNRW